MSDLEDPWMVKRRQIYAEGDKILRMSLRIMEDMASKVRLNLLQSKVLPEEVHGAGL